MLKPTNELARYIKLEAKMCCTYTSRFLMSTISLRKRCNDTAFTLLLHCQPLLSHLLSTLLRSYKLRYLHTAVMYNRLRRRYYKHWRITIGFPEVFFSCFPYKQHHQLSYKEIIITYLGDNCKSKFDDSSGVFHDSRSGECYQFL